MVNQQTEILYNFWNTSQKSRYTRSYRSAHNKASNLSNISTFGIIYQPGQRWNMLKYLPTQASIGSDVLQTAGLRLRLVSDIIFLGDLFSFQVW